MSSPVTEGILAPFSAGLGFPDWLDVTQPAAGANASVTVPGDWGCAVIAARAVLTTSATVANRFVSIDYVDARGTVRASSGTAVAIPASQTNVQTDFQSGRGSVMSASGSPTAAPLLYTYLPPGFTIRFTVLNIDTTDQLSKLSLWLAKYPTGARGYPTGAYGDPDAD